MGIPQRHDAILLRIVMFRSFVVLVFHFRSLMLAETFRRAVFDAWIVAGKSAHLVLIGRTRWSALRSNQINIDRVADTFRLGCLLC